MAEFIGARISLVSKSDIRYVGTLHEINSETSTVALENVSMLGTEGRRPDNEVAALDSIYEYILFRGTDVKDLRIEEAPALIKSKTPQIPNDPAILGRSSRPVPQARSSNQLPTSSTHSNGQQILTASQNTSVLPPTSASYGQHPQYPQFYSHPAGWGRGAPPGHTGYTTVPYAGPPVWYPGSQHSFSPGSQYMPYGYPTGQTSTMVQQQSSSSSKSIPIGAVTTKTPAAPTQQSKNDSETKNLPKAAEMPAAPLQKIPTPPVISKPPIETNAVVSSPVLKQESSNTPDVAKSTSTDPKTANHIKPALPLRKTSVNKEAVLFNSSRITNQKSIESPATLRETTQAATAAVAAAIAKLPATVVNGDPVDDKGLIGSVKNARNINRSNIGVEKVNRVNHRAQVSKGGNHRSTVKVEVPTEDFDFESANAKFNKEDLIREARTGSPFIKGESHQRPIGLEKAATYNKATSFFDNISSEVKDRQDSGNSKPGGREWRGEELKKNLETFGQESIDNGHRGGYRGRGRGRGSYRGRSYKRNVHSSRGRAEHQNRIDAQTVS